MQRIVNPLFEMYELTPDEIEQAKLSLANPLVQAYISTLISEDINQYALADLYAEFSATGTLEAAAMKLLVDNAFFRGVVAVAKRIIIVDKL